MDNEKALEQKRVDDVMNEIQKQLDATQIEYDKAHKETTSVERNYVQNARVNTYEVDDQMETNAEIQQQKNLVAKTIENETILKKQLSTLKILQDSAYFGRIDIHENGEEDSETLYIGTSSLVDENQDFLIYDWRAPISSIYYNGTLGPVSYETPMGEQFAELKKKRQFIIKKGVITNMFDTNETIGDEILQSVLGEHSDEYMRNIVATIQAEQNDIIRDVKHDLLLVQGVAGSGKTSAILQRIAFLLYHSRDKLNAEQIVLFSPNLLFSHYISEVLPSLGEKNMRQITLAEFLNNRFEGLQVESLFDKYEKKITSSKKINSIESIKEDPQFMHTVEEYVQNVSSSQLRFTDIMLDSEIFFSHNEIHDIYSQLPQAMKPSQKFAETKNLLIKQLNRKIKENAQADWVRSEIENLSDEEYYDLLGTKRRHAFQAIDDEEFYIGRKIVKKRFAPVYDALYNNYFIDYYAQYSDFLANKLPEAVDLFNQNLEFHKIDLVDAAPLLYLRDLLTGSGRNQAIAHLFIDEMQDYTLPQLMYLKYIFPNAKLTLLGDSEQALFNEFRTPQELLDYFNKHLNVKKSRIIKLNKSYRSTQQITNFMKALLPDGNEIQAFTRQGKKPELIIASKENGLHALKLELKQRDLSSPVALITKNQSESDFLYQKLRKSFDSVTLLEDKDRSLPKGIVILPIYLAKGLEFDDVIAYDISHDNYSGINDTGILYTICSRAMHRLTLISCGKPSSLIMSIPSDLYTTKSTVTL